MLGYLQRQLDRRKPETYTAMVTEVRSMGAMVDITELGLKGLVKRLSLSDDHYRFVPERGRLVGRQRGNEIAPGDQLKVQVEGIDLHKKQADFCVVKTRPPRDKKKSKSAQKTRPEKSPKRKGKQRQPKARRRRK